MNTYHKFCPNVFVAKCEEQHEKGAQIIVQTKYFGEHRCIVFNQVGKSATHFFYSVVRVDGFNVQEWAKRRAARLQSAAGTATRESGKYWEAANEGKEFLSLGEPIKVGHHSEKRHRALIERNWNRMGKSVEFSEKAQEAKSKAEYWENKAEEITLAMPESLEYFKGRLEKAVAYHQGLKDGVIERTHTYSLTYAKKDVNELRKKVEIAELLWGGEDKNEPKK